MTTRFLSIRSEDRISKSISTSDFVVKFAAFKARYFELKFTRITNTIYNIDSTNNTLVIEFDVSFTVWTLTIPDGLYSSNELAAEIENQFQIQATASAVTATFEVIISPTLLITITTDTSLRVNSTGLMNSLLGYSTTTNSAYGLSIEAEEVSKINKPESLFIDIKELGDTITCSNGRNYTYYVPLVINTNSQTIGPNKGYGQVSDIGEYKFIQELNVKLLNDVDIVNLHGSDWEILLKCW